MEAALPQIKSLNPLVTITPLPTLSPFISSSTSTSQETIEDFLKREKVDLVCGTDLDRSTLERINSACRATRTSFYGAGSYGYIGYIFADLGSSFEYVSSYVQCILVSYERDHTNRQWRQQIKRWKADETVCRLCAFLRSIHEGGQQSIQGIEEKRDA